MLLSLLLLFNMSPVDQFATKTTNFIGQGIKIRRRKREAIKLTTGSCKFNIFLSLNKVTSIGKILLLILLPTIYVAINTVSAGTQHSDEDSSTSFDRTSLKSQHLENYSFNANLNNEHDHHHADVHREYYPFNEDLHTRQEHHSNQEINSDAEISENLPDLSGQHQINQQNNNNKLEFLSHQLAREVCKLDRGCQRKDRLNDTFLNYCSRYKLESVLSNQDLMYIMHDSSEECEKRLLEYIQLDQIINHFYTLFAKLLTRYNCHNGYSVKWSCEDCKSAYKDWLCSTNSPYYMNGEQIKPCISFCERVEQRCPYLHPIQKEQYGGQPVFICKDSNIPFVPEITPDIPYSDPAKCYDLCHLSHNYTELITDSLSKYEYDKCPDKGSIAEQVRSDPSYCGSDRTSSQQYNVSNTQSETGRAGAIDENSSINYTKTDESVAKIGTSSKDMTELPIHIKKLNELKEVIAIYNSQPESHSLGHH